MAFSISYISGALLTWPSKKRRTIFLCVIVNMVIIPLIGLTIYGGIEKNDMFLAFRSGLLGPVYLIGFVYLIIPSIILTVICCSALYEVAKRKPNLSHPRFRLIGTSAGLFLGLFVIAFWGLRFQGDAPLTALITGGCTGTLSGLLSSYICQWQWEMK